ncbi:MAG TPA: DUF4396 domain-containing protein [Candidatus Competibacteraceae bacterium]|nr:DUF4396 domain-containing protein [Candidatus Competibacteraceae bacterium]
MSEWLTLFASLSLVVAGLCALTVVIDILAGHRQPMWIMNLVWPVTALYAGPLGLWFYVRAGRPASRHRRRHTAKQDSSQSVPPKPGWQTTAVAATHCGSGCTLGDITAESLLLLFPLTLFGSTLFATWVVDFIAAFLFGIAFQYFTIKPMRHLTPSQGLMAALKADTLSLSAWQVGMYGWMAVATFIIFGHELDKTGPVFWFMMQLAMVVGFATSYPVNRWLLKAGIKEKM